MKTNLSELMLRSGVGFGTSGARGLATAMTDVVCYAYTVGFLQYLEVIGELVPPGGGVAVAGDLRPSTGRIMEAVARAIEHRGYHAIDCGRIPSPAVALFGLKRRIPSIMVTGSHIPDDRNGIKFNKCSGEVLKDDERGIASQVVEIDDARFDSAGSFARVNSVVRERCTQVMDDYVSRYLDFFGSGALKGLRVGVYQHSAVGRDLLVQILSGLGAETAPLGRSETFVPVDTEAIRPEDVRLAQEWSRSGDFDAIISADGDSDRPLVSDEQGKWLRGDVAGVLCARFLEADCVCAPVSCNTVLEKCGWFKQVQRTRIGSPYVIAAMNQAAAAGAERVVGYEANGGFLIHSHIERNARRLQALPTRDATIVILSVLLLARELGKTVSQLAATLPQRFTASDRLKNFPTERSAEILARFNTGSDQADKEAAASLFGQLCGAVGSIDRTDGVRITFANNEILHLRPSGNAPEFRCYAEAHKQDRANELTTRALSILSGVG
jgi:phosphomannomutase